MLVDRSILEEYKDISETTYKVKFNIQWSHFIFKIKGYSANIFQMIFWQFSIDLQGPSLILMHHFVSVLHILVSYSNWAQTMKYWEVLFNLKATGRW